MAPQAATKLTYEDYLELPDDGKRYELLDGELYANPSPIDKHQLIIVNIVAAMRAYTKQTREGAVYVSPHDVILAPGDVVQPDVFFVSKENAHKRTRRGIDGAPDLLVEVLSESSRRLDQRIKFARYELYKVPEYWIIDPEIDEVKIYRHNGRVFEQIATTDPLTSPLLAAFTLPLADVFALP